MKHSLSQYHTTHNPYPSGGVDTFANVPTPSVSAPSLCLFLGALQVETNTRFSAGERIPEVPDVAALCPHPRVALLGLSHSPRPPFCPHQRRQWNPARPVLPTLTGSLGVLDQPYLDMQ